MSNAKAQMARSAKPAYYRVRNKLTKRDKLSKKDWTDWYAELAEEPEDVPGVERLLNAFAEGQKGLDDYTSQKS